MKNDFEYKFKIVHKKNGDSFVVKSSSYKNLRKVVKEECEKRFWNADDCYSEKI